MIDAGWVLEQLNGLGMAVDGLFLGWGLLYLVMETRRRHLDFRDWILRLPPHMDFVIAVLAHDLGVWLKAALVWMWRRSGAGPFTSTELIILALGALLVAVGGLCKIRAVTRPEYGNGPWLGASAFLVGFLLVFR